MKTVYKYELRDGQENIIEMPKDAQILSIQNQDGVICVWAFVDTENKMCERVFEIYGTGHNMDDFHNVDRMYMATVQHGPFVWHIYERFDV